MSIKAAIRSVNPSMRFQKFYDARYVAAKQTSFRAAQRDLLAAFARRGGLQDRLYPMVNYNEVARIFARKTHTECETTLINVIISVYIMKDPKKQNLAEKVQIEYLRAAGIDIQKLPNTGPNSLHLGPAGVVSGRAVGSSHNNGTNRNSKACGNSGARKQATAPKSIDAVVAIRGEVYYATMKYTEAAGGAQQNQYNDVQKFIDAARQSSGQFIAILDGAYYSQETATRHGNVYVFSSDQLVEMHQLGLTPGEYVELVGRA